MNWGKSQCHHSRTLPEGLAPDFSSGSGFAYSDIMKGIRFRYSVSIGTIAVLYLLRSSLPFPYPEFLWVTVFFLLVNALLHLATVSGRARGPVYIFCAYLDTLMSPFIFHCTGGFLSPFVVTHFITMAGCIYSNNQSARNYGRNVMIMLLISYLGVAFAHKSGLIHNSVGYSREMMGNTVFFWYIVGTVAAVITGGYSVLSGLRADIHFNLQSMVRAYRKIDEALATKRNEDVFTALTSCLAGALGGRHALIGELSDDGTTLSVLAISPENPRAGELAIPLGGSCLGSVLERGSLLSIDRAGDRFPGDPLISMLQAQSCIGMPVCDPLGKQIGIVSVFHNRDLPTDYVQPVVLRIFASRAAIELEGRKNALEQRRFLQQLTHSRNLETLGQLAGGIAHNFNNLLFPMVGFAEVIGKVEHLTPGGYRQVKRIADLGMKGAELINKLKAFSARMPATLCELDIHQCIHETTALLEVTLDRRIIVTSRLLARHSTILGDRAQIESALLNLALNARDAMMEGGELTFATENVCAGEDLRINGARAQARGLHVKLEVIDTGTGMDEATRKRLFEPFFTTKGIGKGTGLGLASVYGTVQQHKGAIAVRSQPGAGATFSLLFPALEAFELEHATEKAATVTRRTGRILVVDDEEAIREAISAMLSILGYEVVCCKDGMEAVEYYQCHFDSVDLIILDMIMPNLCGAECFRRLREIKPAATILVLSGHTEEHQDLPTDHSYSFLSKPIRFETLSEAVSLALQQGRT